MKIQKAGKWLLGAVVTVAAAGGVFAWVSNSSRAQKLELPPEATSAHDPAAVAVTLATVQSTPVPRTVEAVGTLWGFEELTISAKVEGQIKKVVRSVADRITPGELLLEIDPTNYQLSFRQADRALQVELARLGLTEPPPASFDVTRLPAVVQASARLEQARGKYDRVQAAGRSVSPEELGDKTAEYRVAQAEADNQVQLAKAGLMTIHLKKEALNIAEQQLKDTQVLTPTPTRPVPGAAGVTYVVSQRSVSEGSFVRPGAELYRLAIDQTLKLRVSVPERYSQDVRVAQQVDVTTAANAKPYSGMVALVYPTVDPTCRTFDVEIHVPNPKYELKPGSFAKAAIRTRVDSDAVTVPLDAIVEFAGITKLFVVEGGKAREMQVVQGVQTTKWVEIARPKLTPGMKVVTSGQSALAEGTPVFERPSK